jgi:hypothetical protein
VVDLSPFGSEQSNVLQGKRSALPSIYVVRGTPKKPVPDQVPLITTPFAALDEHLGQVRVVFNRGLLSTQAMNRGTNAPAKNAEKLRKSIGRKNGKVRKR